MTTVVEILQSIKQADMSPMLNRIYGSPGGVEALDALMKYLYVLNFGTRLYLDPLLDHHCLGFTVITRRLTDLVPGTKACLSLVRALLEQ